MKLCRALVLALSCGAAWIGAAWLAPAAASAEPMALSLADAIRRARDNPLARAARQQEYAAAARAAEARSTRWPRLTLNAFIAPSPDIDCQNADCTRTSPREIGPSVAGVFGGGRIELAQPLYTFGKIDAAIAAAGYAESAQAALADGVTEDVALETARAYFGVRYAREIELMLGEGIEQLRKAEETLSQRLEKGDADVTVQDRLRLSTFGAEIEIRLSQAREKEQIALAGLRALVGEPEADTVQDAFEAVEIDLAKIEAHLTQARTRRAESRAAREGVKALSERTRMEQARFWPDLLAVGALGITRASAVDDPPSAFANDPFNADRAELALLLRWSFDVGQWARVDQARAERGRGDALLAVAEATAEFKVREAYQQAVEAHARLEAARIGERSARGWVASVAQAEAIGVTTARDIADAYLAYFTLRSRTLESTYEWNFAIASLGRATGSLLTIFERR